MDAFFAIVALFYLAIRLGKEDGKWGLFTFLIILLLAGMISSALNR